MGFSDIHLRAISQETRVSPDRCYVINLPLYRMGKFDWGVWCVIIFLYVQFWILLAAVSKGGTKVRTVALPVVKLVNKSGDTQNWDQNKPEYAICVIFTTRS